MSSPFRSASIFVALLVLCFGVAAVGGLTTAQSVTEWYPSLVRPWWRPPNWLFGPVWTILYTAMAVAMWLVWRQAADVRRPAALFACQLLLNAAWSPVFFGLRRLDLGLVVIVAMWLAIAVTIGAFRRESPLAALLLLPYLAWVSFATALNAWLWWMN
jgi:benzodiazapine receptor